MPLYPTTPRTDRLALSAANSNRDGTGTVVDSALTGTAGGTEVHRVRVSAIGNTDEGAVRIFRYDGTNSDLLFELSVPKRTVAANLPPWSTVIELHKAGGPLLLSATTQKLRFSTEKADSFRVVIEGWDMA